jgi:hypothetical protein
METTNTAEAAMFETIDAFGIARGFDTNFFDYAEWGSVLEAAPADEARAVAEAIVGLWKAGFGDNPAEKVPCSFLSTLGVILGGKDPLLLALDIDTARRRTEVV